MQNLLPKKIDCIVHIKGKHFLYYLFPVIALVVLAIFGLVQYIDIPEYHNVFGVFNVITGFVVCLICFLFQYQSLLLLRCNNKNGTFFIDGSKIDFQCMGNHFDFSKYQITMLHQQCSSAIINLEDKTITLGEGYE